MKNEMKLHRKADPGNLEELYSFFDFARSSRTINPNVIHNWTGAIGAIAHCLESQEKTIGYLNQNLELVRERLKRTNTAISGSTIDTYINRAASALSYYLVWKNDQSRWEKEVVLNPKKSFSRLSLPNYLPQKSSAEIKPEILTESFSRSKNRIQLRAEGGGLFQIEFPEHFLMKDVLRVIWALAAHAKDFDYKQLIDRMWTA
jgi:hypothetical protein